MQQAGWAIVFHKDEDPAVRAALEPLIARRRDQVGDSKVQDLVAYIRAFGPSPAQPIDPAATDFEKQFRQLQDQWDTLQKQLKELTLKQ